MQTYKTLTRTTLDKTNDLPNEGVYVIAYLGKVMYVGKTEDSVSHRLYGHWLMRSSDALGLWMDKLKADWHNIRLDVLEPPDGIDIRYWLRKCEAECIRKFSPLFNTQLMV